jgi:hypothetical protein
MLARMRIVVKTPRSLCWGTLALCLCVSAVGASAVAAEPADDRELHRWVPSFALLAGANAQNAEGFLETSDVLGPNLPSAAEPKILPDAPRSESTRMMTPFVGVSMELMTPAWTSLPGRPRAHARVDVNYAFGPKYNIPTIGDPGTFTTSPRVTSVIEERIHGQGGKATALVKPLLITAGAGFAVTLKAWDRVLRIKPSVEYVREEIKLSGVVRRAVAQVVSGPTVDPPYFRHITLTGRDTKVYHGLGPGLELELDTRRAGPFVLSLFLGAKAWAFLNDEKQVVLAENEWGESALFELQKDRWAFGGNIGLRFRWVPE